MKLTKKNYFSAESEKEFCGFTQLKNFMDCEAAAMAALRGEYKPEKSDVFLVGSAVHAWNEGTLEQFQDKHPEMYKKDGCLYAKFEIIDTLIHAIEKDEAMMKHLSGQKEVIFTGDIFGLPFKIMIDSYNPEEGFFSDLKCVKDFEPIWNDEARKKLCFVSAYKYEFQMAIYAEIEKQANQRAEKLTPYIVAISKQDPPDKEIFSGFADIADVLLSSIRPNIERVILLKSGKADPTHCGKCQWCRQTKKASIIDFKYYRADNKLSRLDLIESNNLIEEIA